METTCDACLELPFVDYAHSVPAALEQLDAGPRFAAHGRVLLKPNLVEAKPHPITTAAACVEAVLAFARDHGVNELIIAEGCGAAGYDTDHCFATLGYVDLAQRYGARLVDLNHEATVCLTRDDCQVFPECHLPRLAMETYLVSLPVLKAHSLATVTGSLKNMMGLAPPQHYQQGGHWKKSAFHAHMHQAIVELNRYRRPDCSLLDASIGLAEFHLGGPHCDPPVNRLLAGYDALAVDRRAAGLLGLDWRTIDHLHA